MRIFRSPLAIAEAWSSVSDEHKELHDTASRCPVSNLICPVLGAVGGVSVQILRQHFHL